ncbi:hypothetical protein [Candidatus Aalborgicola defluviihabitans]|uniref:hypothetical protein n=1 Tax=Candidatus Aalborgicola defluviihabitans TaxID=3386187 RepID=UPI00390A0CC9|nr:hypothetical protein [Burkholderiales bacterium]
MREGFDPTQLDLNKLFLDFVLSPGQLNSMGRGEFFLSDAADPAATPSAYARIAAKNRARFFTIDERQRSGADGLDFILAQLCEPYRLDVRLSEVSADFLDSNPVCSFYTQWFKAAVLREQSLNNSSLVAISVPMGPQLLPALLLSKQVRQVISAPIVFGGPSFSLMSSEELEKFLCLSPTESRCYSSI